MNRIEPRIYDAEPLEQRYYFESLMDDVELSYVHGASSGVRVTERTAMRTAAVFSCIRVIAESIAGIDLHVYRRLPRGGNQIFPGWLDTLLSIAPNPSQTRVEFLEQIIRHFEIWHRCYAEVVQGDGGRVVALIPLHPSRVTPKKLPNGRLSFIYTDGKTGNTKTYSQDEMFWMHGFSDDGETGDALLELGKETIGLCRAMELHAARFFGNGARPGVVLETEQSLAAETVERLRESWERIHRGPQNSHRTAILDSGVKAHEFDGMSMQDAQFSQALEFETSRVCALFRVPPHKIQLLNRATFSNVEQQEIDFRNSCIAPRCVRLEQAFARSLIADPANFFVRFDLNDLERGDSASRISYLTAAVDRGILSVNEARAREGLNPVEGGDVHFFPLNMTTLQVMNQPVAVEAASVQPVLDRLAAGGITPESAKVLLAVQNPMLSDEQVAAIVDGAYVAAAPDRAQVNALLQVIEDVASGVLSASGAVAVIAAAFPQLDAAQVKAIIGGVRVGQNGQPPQPPGLPAPAPAADAAPAPAVPADPTADPLAAATSGANMAATALNGAQISSLLNILTQTASGAISADAAVLVITSSFPTISENVARQMVSSTPPRPEGSAPESGAAQAGGAVAGSRACTFHRLEPRDCGTGSGGFQPGNECAKGGGTGGGDTDADDSSGADLPSHGTAGDAEASSTTIESDGGDIVQTERQDVNADEYLNEVESDAEERGMVADFKQAEGMQESADIDPDAGAVQAYVGAAYGYFTGNTDALSELTDADNVIDTFGYDHGTIDSETASMLENERMEEAESEWETLDKKENISDEWDTMSDDDKEAAKEEWLNDKRTEIQEGIEQQRTEAREHAIREMTRELESGTASSTLECCLQLYRGLSVPKSVFDEMLSDGAVTHTGVNSWTTSRNIARGFSGGTTGGGPDRVSVVLIARGPRVGLINTNNSMDEKEVIRPPTKMKIQRMVRTKNKVFLYVDEDEDYKG